MYTLPFKYIVFFFFRFVAFFFKICYKFLVAFWSGIEDGHNETDSKSVCPFTWARGFESHSLRFSLVIHMTFLYITTKLILHDYLHIHMHYSSCKMSFFVYVIFDLMKSNYTAIIKHHNKKHITAKYPKKITIPFLFS